MSTRLYVIFLSMIVLIAAVLRLTGLATIPPSLYWEEVALGYDAYALAKTGKDHQGNPYPVIAFPSFGDYKPSGYFYALAPIVGVMGLTPEAVRLPSALAGVLAVFLLIMIVRDLFGKQLALIAGIVFALQPWHLQFSRGGWEVNLALTCILLGTYGLLRARKRPWTLAISVIPFAAAMYTYHAARLFVPLLAVVFGSVLIAYWVRHLPWRRWIGAGLVSMILAGLLVFPLLKNLQDVSVSSRFSQTSVFTRIEPVLASNAAIQQHGNTRIARLLYHRYWFFAAEAFSGFMSHFTPSFLVVRGDGNLRHGTGKYGLLYGIELVFIITAVVAALLVRDKRIAGVGVWIVLAAIAPALVLPAPHALRFLFAAPAFALFSAYGIQAFARAIPRRYLSGYRFMVSLAMAVSFFSYLHWYRAVYPARAASSWQYGYKELYDALNRHQKPAETVFVSRTEGRPAMYYLFYSGYDPARIQAQAASLPKDQLELLAIDQYRFVDGTPGEKGLYATAPDAVPVDGVTVLETIRRPDGTTVFVVWRRT